MPPLNADDRREPLPDLAQLPGWLLARLPRWGKLALAAVVATVIGLILALRPGIEGSKEERARDAAAERRERTAERIRVLTAEQRPRFGTSAVPPTAAASGERLAGRRRMLATAEGAMLADARARGGEPVKRVDCEPFPRRVSGTPPHEELRRGSGRYGCLAVTSDVAATEFNRSATIGYPYRALLDFETGRYAFCKISGRPAEGALERELLVTVPRACGGR